MIILIGGVGYAGKTFMAQKLLEKYHYPYLSIDHLKMGLYRADIDFGITPCDNTEHIGDKLWPILKGIIMTNIENKQNLIIEGAYLFPDKVSELPSEYLANIVSFYLGFSEEYIKENFNSQILENRCAIEARGYENEDTLEGYLQKNKAQKNICEKHKAKYFEIKEDYQKEIEAVYSWIDSELSK